MSKFRGLTEGKDVDGITRRLGDRDCMGHIVGFIDEDENCWETVAERDGALTAGRYMDAMIAWEKAGKSDPEPKAHLIALEVCLDFTNVPTAVREARDSWSFVIAYRDSLA